MPEPVEKQSALTRLAARVADGASLEAPDTFKTNKHYAVNADVEDIYKRWDAQVTPEELPVYTTIVRALLGAGVSDERSLQRAINEQRKALRMTPRKSKLLHTYQVILPTAPAVSNEGRSSPLLALSFSLGLVGTASSRR